MTCCMLLSKTAFYRQYLSIIANIDQYTVLRTVWIMGVVETTSKQKSQYCLTILGLLCSCCHSIAYCPLPLAHRLVSITDRLCLLTFALSVQPMKPQRGLRPPGPFWGGVGGDHPGRLGQAATRGCRRGALGRPGLQGLGPPDMLGPGGGRPWDPDGRHGMGDASLIYIYVYRHVA